MGLRSAPVPYDRYCFGAYLPRPFLNSTKRALAVIGRRNTIAKLRIYAAF
jgi:hypothetical protein